MPTIVAASDADWVRDHVRAALCGPGFEVIHVERGHDVRKAVADRHPDLVIVDLQIGNMGGMAVSIDLRLEESGGFGPTPTRPKHLRGSKSRSARLGSLGT
jgi:DNA-binding response OmpR family regulator